MSRRNPNYITLSDEESNEEVMSDNNVNNFVAFMTNITKEHAVSPTVVDRPSDKISDDEEDLTKEELMANYQMLFMKWSKLTHAYTTEETERRIKMMNSSTNVLDEILLQGKRSGNNTGIGFSGDNGKKRMELPIRKWVAAGVKSNL
ncbi:hypothetical protein LIER_29961 [Lithospermum erythrorhizon]|uniref:Uncharacterized protein n=1 Tax=Lithospermum erythrorhizon TaxID=34254 RepID=A0AAV3RL26_LITER